MSLGPIEVVMIAFPGNQFTGAIIPEISRLIEANTISVVDALLVSKDADGEITFVEFDELNTNEDVTLLAGLFDEANALISDDDVREFASGTLTEEPRVRRTPFGTAGRDALDHVRLLGSRIAGHDHASNDRPRRPGVGRDPIRVHDAAHELRVR